MPPIPSPPEFFVDRGMGRHFVPDGLRSHGVVVYTMPDLYGDREQEVDDDEWLADAGTRGLVVLTKDKRIRYRPVEINALVENAVRAFVLSSGNLTGPQMRDRLLRHLDRILALCKDTGPFVYVVHETHLARIESI